MVIVSAFFVRASLALPSRVSVATDIHARRALFHGFALCADRGRLGRLLCGRHRRCETRMRARAALSHWTLLRYTLRRHVQVALLFVGFGNVARRFVGLLDEVRPALDALDIQPAVVGITTRRHGGCYDEAGLDASRAARQLAEGGAIGPASWPSALECIARLRSQRAEARIVIETTTLDIRSGEPAISHCRAGFAAGAHVITANKGPAAFAAQALLREAAAAGVSFLFEGAVMDGVPIFNLVRETLPAVEIRGFAAS